MRRRVLLLGGLLLLAPAAPAAAGTYPVRACAIGDNVGPNESWTFAGVKGVSVDSSCGTSASDSIGLFAPAGNRIDGGTAGTMTFTAPPGTTISDFVFERRWVQRGEPNGQGNNRPYLLYSIGRTPFSGAGAYAQGKRDELHAQGEWPGYNGGDVEVANQRAKASFPALSTYNGGQTTLTVTLGCFAGQAICRIPDGGYAENALVGARVNVLESTPPTLEVVKEGLFAPGPRAATDPVIVNAADGVGIRKIEVFDVTVPPPPGEPPFAIFGEDYTAAGTDTGASCSFARPVPCPTSLAREVIPVPPDTLGDKSKLMVRATDAAGNVTDSEPFDVDVPFPSDRGAANGSPATETAKLTAAVRGKQRVRARLGQRVKITGRLTTEAGDPVAGAQIKIGVADKGAGGFYQARKTVVTGAKGRYSYRLKATQSRAVIVGWTAYVNDFKAAARRQVKVDVRASASIKAPRSVRRGRAFTLRGRLDGVAPTSGGVPVVAQVRSGKRWRTIGRGTSKGRNYKVKGRLRASGTQQVRVALPSRGRWPYADGSTRTVKVTVR